MKNLKIKLGLFSLLAILAASAFLTSCEQEVITDQTDTILNQEQLLSAFEQDENVARFVELTTQGQTEFIEKIKENEVDIEAMKALHISENYEAIYEMLGIDVAEFENNNREIQQLAAQIRNDYAALAQECTSCAESNTQDIDAQYEALQIAMSAELEVRWCNWRYYVCIAACSTPNNPLVWLCQYYCWVKYC